jgi:hypothetical protein
MATANSSISEQANEWYTTRGYRECLVSIASPGVLTKDNHGLRTNDRVKLYTTGALPTGLAVETWYYVIYATDHTFSLAATRDGSAITTTGTQSGTHYYAEEAQDRLIPSIESCR